MQAFLRHVGKLAVVEGDHIDTDRIIPARFLSRVSRFGYGELLFADARTPATGIDHPAAEGATVLLTGTNFGCGSSREHAVWALQQFGFRAVIARRDAGSPGFSDIFRGNAGNCGLLLIELGPEEHARIAALGSGGEVAIDLPAQTVNGLPFEIAGSTKDLLVQGLDLIGATLRDEDAISRYERAVAA